MRVDKPSNNITYVNFNVPRAQSHENNPERYVDAPEATDTTEEGKGKLVDFRIFSATHPNIGKSDELKLLSYMRDRGYNDITLEQVEIAIKKYYEDAELLYPLFKKAEDYLSNFEEKISKADLGKMKNVINIFGDGWDNDKKDVRRYINGDDDIPSKKSNEAMKNIIGEYIEILKKECPELEIIIETDDFGNIPKNAMQISIIDGNNTMMLFFEDFIKTMRRGKLSGNELLILDEEEKAKYYYLYDSSTKTMNKVDSMTNAVVGSIKKDAYDEYGEARFYIDEEEPEDDESGPVYYATSEYLSGFNKKLEEDLLFNKENYPKDVNLDDFINMIKNDAEAQYYYQNHDFGFMYSCMREGSFNLNVAEINDLFATAGKLYAPEGYIPQEYINNLINLIEEEDHTFDDDLTDITEGLLIKELKSGKNYHELIYKIISYIKNDRSEDNIVLGLNLSDDKTNMEEVETVFEKINSADETQKTKMISRFNVICLNQDKRICYTKKTVFEYFMEEFK